MLRRAGAPAPSGSFPMAFDDDAILVGPSIRPRPGHSGRTGRFDHLLAMFARLLQS